MRKERINIIKIRGDGNCFYRVLAKELTGHESNYEIIKMTMVSYL